MIVMFSLRFRVFFWMLVAAGEPSLTFRFEDAINNYEEWLEETTFRKFLKKAGWSWSDWIELKEAGGNQDG